MGPAGRLAKARRAVANGHYQLAGDFVEEAARAGYLAAFHAAQAYVVSRTGKHAKTHSGLRATFSRLAHERSEIAPDLLSFLGLAYEYKAIADYGVGDATSPVTLIDALRALDLAARLIDRVGELIEADRGPPQSA